MLQIFISFSEESQVVYFFLHFLAGWFQSLLSLQRLTPCFLLNAERVPSFLLDAYNFELQTIAIHLHFRGQFTLQKIVKITNSFTLFLDRCGKRAIIEVSLLDMPVAPISNSKINVGGLIGGEDDVGIRLQLEAFLRGVHLRLQVTSFPANLQRKLCYRLIKQSKSSQATPNAQKQPLPSSINALAYPLACVFAIQLIINMKSALMRAPAISEIYNQKVTYQNHLKKLQRIREQRKQVLNVDHTRHVQLQHIKDGKSRTFANKFNQSNYHINQSNLKLLNKLENVKSFARYTSYAASDRPRELTPKPLPTPVKRKIIETEKENSRIFFRMRSVSSNLSKDRLLNDYAKAEKIKSRITKYALENNKVALKSEKYFAQNKSNLSNSSLKSSNTERKRSPASFYKREDIIRNRVIKTDLKNFKDRGLPALGHFAQDKAFFTTEPIKSKRAVSQRSKQF